MTYNITMTLTDEEFDRLEPHIDCRDWRNFMDGEFAFEGCSEKMMLWVALSVEYYHAQPEQ